MVIEPGLIHTDLGTVSYRTALPVHAIVHEEAGTAA